MESIYNYEQERIEKARKRVKEIKDFYSHLGAYIFVNVLISVIRIYNNWDDGDALFDLHVFSVWFWWGIGIGIHAVSTFRVVNFLGKDWENRKIKEYMDNNR